MTQFHIDASGLEALREHALKAGTMRQWSDLALEWARAAEATVLQKTAEIEVLRNFGNKDCTAMADEELARRAGMGKPE